MANTLNTLNRRPISSLDEQLSLGRISTYIPAIVDNGNSSQTVKLNLNKILQSLNTTNSNSSINRNDISNEINNVISNVFGVGNNETTIQEAAGIIFSLLNNKSSGNIIYNVSYNGISGSNVIWSEYTGN